MGLSFVAVDMISVTSHSRPIDQADGFSSKVKRANGYFVIPETNEGNRLDQAYVAKKAKNEEAVLDHRFIKTALMTFLTSFLGTSFVSAQGLKRGSPCCQPEPYRGCHESQQPFIGIRSQQTMSVPHSGFVIEPAFAELPTMVVKFHPSYQHGLQCNVIFLSRYNRRLHA
jgi:hypothetical protein